MYFAGRRSTRVPTSATRGPFIVGMWLRSWLRLRGYDARSSTTFTDINDKIYDAAPGESAELAARATEWYIGDTADLGLVSPTTCRRRPSRCRRSSRSSKS